MPLNPVSTSANYTAHAWEYVVVLVGGVTITLPTTPANGTRVAIQGASTTVVAGGGDAIYRRSLIASTGVDFGHTLELVYTTTPAAGNYWRVVADSQPYDNFASMGLLNAVAYGPGTGNPLASGGQSVFNDNDGRVTGLGEYTARVTGVYQVSTAVAFAASTGSLGAVGAVNVDTSYALWANFLFPTSIASGGGSCSVKIPAAGGERIRMTAYISNNLTLQNNVQGRNPTWFQVVQVA